jgi:hypothetical protein
MAWSRPGSDVTFDQIQQGCCSTSHEGTAAGVSCERCNGVARELFADDNCSYVCQQAGASRAVTGAAGGVSSCIPLGLC